MDSKEILEVVKTEGAFAAVSLINDIDDPKAAAQLFSESVRQAYWVEKGPNSLVIIGNAGIEYCLLKAKELAVTDESLSGEMLAWAKTIAYDVGANTWPGWDDEGVSISEGQQWVGYQAALLNLKLAIDLKKPADKVSIAYWLVGAHHLAAKRYEDSKALFQKGLSIDKEAGNTLSAIVNEGYLAMAQVLSGESGTEKLTTIITKLKSIDSDDSKFYAQQLETAFRVFNRP